jgi:hypothetical protein
MNTNFRPPDWYPLERALTREFGAAAIDATTSFWFIGFVDGPDDVGELRLYEHSTTRRRVALDADGRAYRHHPEAGRYSPMAAQDALVHALA